MLWAAEEAGFGRFHLVGYSFGGAVALTVAARHPDRVAGLGLLEFAPMRSLETTLEGDSFWREFERLMTLPSEERSRAATSMILKPGTQVPAPPPGPPPAWMAKRAAAYEHLMRAPWFYPLELEALPPYQGSVYVGLGTLSHPAFERESRRLAELWPQTEIDTHEGLHHMNPPHLAEPGRLAKSLLQAWSRSRANQSG